MDNQTRHGFGGVASSALFTVIALLAPQMPTYILVPALLMSAGGAVWGFWPWLRDFPSLIEHVREFLQVAALYNPGNYPFDKTSSKG